MQGIDFTVNILTSMIFVNNYSCFYTAVLQFKNDLRMKDNYLVEGTVS